jgi:hypothetical protein
MSVFISPPLSYDEQSSYNASRRAGRLIWVDKGVLGRICRPRSGSSAAQSVILLAVVGGTDDLPFIP